MKLLCNREHRAHAEQNIHLHSTRQFQTQRKFWERGTELEPGLEPTRIQPDLWLLNQALENTGFRKSSPEKAVEYKRFH